MLALQRLEVLLQEPSSDASTTAGDEEEKWVIQWRRS
jgi:hypothetical protein